MKNFFYFIVMLSCFFNISAHGQAIKKYSGIYSLSAPWNQEGKASYSYKEENSKKIFHGKFTLLFTGSEANKGFSENISGNYKNGLRDGKWVFIIAYTDMKMFNENVYKTGACTLSINYKEGLPDGIWVYTSSFKIRQKNANSKTGFTAFSKVTMEHIKLSYKLGILNTFKNESPGENMFQYLFDEAGYIQRITNEKDKNTDGEIWHHGLDKPSVEEIKNLDAYLKYMSNSKDSLAYLSYSYKTILFSENMLQHFMVHRDNIIYSFSKVYNHVFFWNDIPGDLCYDAAKSNKELYSNATITGFLTREKTIQTPKEKALPEEQVRQFKEIYSLLQSLKNVLYDSKILKCADVSEATQSYDKCKKFQDTISILNRVVTDLELFYKGTGKAKKSNDIVENIAYLKTINERDLLTNIYSRLTEIDKSVQPLLLEMEGFYKKVECANAIKEGVSLIEQKNYDAAKKAFLRAQFLNPNDTTPKAKLEEIKSLEVILEADTKRMSNLNYLVDNFRKIPAAFKYGEIKKNLYETYLILKDYFLAGIDNPTNNSLKKLEISADAIKFVDKMNALLNQNTEELEKQLKKIKDPKKIKEILGL